MLSMPFAPSFNSGLNSNFNFEINGGLTAPEITHEYQNVLDNGLYNGETPPNLGFNSSLDLSFGWFEFIGEQLKKTSLVFFAIVLVGLGIYLLAKSTDTGAAVINVAKNI